MWIFASPEREIMDLDKIISALTDPKAPWYGSDLVEWVADLIDEYKKQKVKIKELEEGLIKIILFLQSTGDSRQDSLYDPASTLSLLNKTEMKIYGVLMKLLKCNNFNELMQKKAKQALECPDY